MEISMMKVALISVTALLAGLLLKRLREELSIGVRIGGTVLIFVIVMVGVKDLFASFSDLLSMTSFSGYAEPMIRAVGLAFLCKICADICRDCGENGLASGVESAGKIGILLLAFPMMKELLETASVFWSMSE